MKKILANRWAPFVFAVAIFAADLVFPAGYEIWMLYLFPTLWISWVSTPRSIYTMAGFCSLLTIAGSLVSPEYSPFLRLEADNRAIAIAVGWVFSFLMARNRKLEQEFRKSRGCWETRISERSAELEKAQKSLQMVNSQLIDAQEKERKRIAQEMHDSLAGQISAAKMKLEDTLRSIHADVPPSGLKIKEVIGDLQQCLTETRRIMANLRPSVLDDIGLVPTIQWFCREFQKIHPDISIERRVEIKEDEIPEPFKLVVFRVIQESLNNTAKHSGADRVDLVLKKEDGRMELTIRDNGRGFEMEKIISERRGLGLYNMKERVEFSGGQYAIESGEGAGTKIQASWPC